MGAPSASSKGASIPREHVLRGVGAEQDRVVAGQTRLGGDHHHHQAGREECGPPRGHRRSRRRQAPDADHICRPRPRASAAATGSRAQSAIRQAGLIAGGTTSRSYPESCKDRLAWPPQPDAETGRHAAGRRHDRLAGVGGDVLRRPLRLLLRAGCRERPWPPAGRGSRPATHGGVHRRPHPVERDHAPGHQGRRTGQREQGTRWLGATFILGALFIANQASSGRRSTSASDRRLRLDLLRPDRIPRPPRDRGAGPHGGAWSGLVPATSRPRSVLPSRSPATTGTSSTSSGSPCSRRLRHPVMPSPPSPPRSSQSSWQ